MHFLIEDDDLFKKCNIIWDKVSADTKKIDNQPVYDKFFLKDKRKSDGDEVTDIG